MLSHEILALSVLDSFVAHHHARQAFIRRGSVRHKHFMKPWEPHWQFFLASYIAVLLGSAAAQRWEPLTACWTCVSRSRILSPVTGTDIEPSYL